MIHQYGSQVTCSTCGKPAIRRSLTHLDAETGLQRNVFFDTHSLDPMDEAHLAALRRLDNFHNRVAALTKSFDSVSDEQRKLKYGRIHSLEFATVCPTACNPRVDCIPEITVRAFGLVKSFTTPPRPLEGLTMEALIEEIRAQADAVSEELKAQKQERDESGDY